MGSPEQTAVRHESGHIFSGSGDLAASVIWLYGRQTLTKFQEVSAK